MKEDLNEVESYEPPSVVVYGDLADLTAGNSTGAFLDQDFPTGTPFGDLTFSD